MQKQYRDMQMGQMRTNMEREKGQQEWRAGLPGLLQPKPQEIDQFTGTTEIKQPDPAQLQNYLMDPRSPFADKILEQRLFPKAAEGFTLTPGGVRYDANGKVIAQAAEKPSDKPTKVQEYEYAKANGYKGTLEQYVSIGPSIMAGAMAPLRQAQVENIQAENDYNLPPPVAPRPRPPAGGVSVTAGGKTYTFPTAAAANQFKAQAGIK